GRSRCAPTLPRWSRPSSSRATGGRSTPRSRPRWRRRGRSTSPSPAPATVPRTARRARPPSGPSLTGTRRDSLLVQDSHGAGRPAEDPLGDRAEEHPAEATTPAGADDEQVRALRHLDEDV